MAMRLLVFLDFKSKADEPYIYPAPGPIAFDAAMVPNCAEA
jgi:hypothetical protein